MKKTMIMLSLALISWGANAQHDYAQINHSEMDSKMKDKSIVPSVIKVEHTFSANIIIGNYLILKDALVEDKSSKAAFTGKLLLDALAKFDLSTQSQSKQKELGEIIEDATEQAEHIIENSGKIEHQREHFEVLSNDIKDLIVIMGSDRALNQIFCQMYDNGKGGMWLSTSNEIKNPYFGSKMLTCGSVQLEITVK